MRFLIFLKFDVCRWAGGAQLRARRVGSHLPLGLRAGCYESRATSAERNTVTTSTVQTMIEKPLADLRGGEGGALLRSKIFSISLSRLPATRPFVRASERSLIKGTHAKRSQQFHTCYRTICWKSYHMLDPHPILVNLFHLGSFTHIMHCLWRFYLRPVHTEQRWKRNQNLGCFSFIRWSFCMFFDLFYFPWC